MFLLVRQSPNFPAFRTHISTIVQIGEVMRAAGLGKVVASGPDSKFKVGDLVSGIVGAFTVSGFASVKHVAKVESSVLQVGLSMRCLRTNNWRNWSMFFSR